MVIANTKERSGCGWFIAGCLLGPFALVVAALPSLKKTPQSTLSTEGYVPCPECRELVHPQAKKCKHCGSELLPQDPTKKPCGSCKRLVSINEEYCPVCGYNLGAGPMP